MKISEGYRNSEEKLVHDVSFNNDICFKEVENIKKFEKCQRNKCKHYDNCQEGGGVVRVFDCQKSQDKVRFLYNIITSSIVFTLIILIFFVFHIKIIKGIGFLIISLVILDMLCSIIEDVVPKISERLFYNKLKGAKKKKDKSEKIKEEKKKAEELKKMSNNPQYKKVIEAENFVKELKKFCQNNDLGRNKENINKCIVKLLEIIKELKKDSSAYGRVAFLFESYLPKFYNTLNYYSSFGKANVVEKGHEEILSQCVNKFLKFIESQRVQVVFDKEYTEHQFKATAEMLGKMIDEGED